MLNSDSRSNVYAEVKTMYKYILTLMAFIFLMPNDLLAHSGRTDSNCGHNCSESSKKKGLCTGYHYHFKNCPRAVADTGGSNAELMTSSVKESSEDESELHKHLHAIEEDHSHS